MAAEQGVGKSWVRALQIVTALSAGLSALTKVFDPDVWWYVRVGQWMWDQHALPKHDPFSFTGQLPYGSHPVLSELSFYFAHRLAGVHGLVGLRAILLALLALLVLGLALERRAPSATTLAAAALTFALWYAAAAFRLGPKPELFSYLGLAVVLLVLRASTEHGRHRLLWALPPIFAVWSNLHRGGVMALALMAAASAVLLARQPTRSEGRRVALTVALCLVASAANPSGIGYLTSTFSVVSTASYAKYIAEWGPVSPAFLVGVGKWFSVLGGLWVVAALRRRRLDPETVIVVLATAAALKSLRLVPFAALTMVPGCSRLLSDVLAALARKVVIRPAVWGLLALASSVLGVALQFVTSLPPSAWGSGTLTWRVPVDGVEFARRHPPPGERMWNNLNYGGYLLYALGPATKVFIDGRNDMVYAPDFYEAAQRATTDPAELTRQLQQYSIDFAIVQSSGLVEKRYLGLYASPSFEPVYMDDLVTIMVRRSAASTQYLSEHGYRSLRPHTAVLRAANAAIDPERAELEREARRNVEQAPRSIRAWYVLALLEKAGGNSTGYALARERIAQLAAEREIEISLP